MRPHALTVLPLLHPPDSTGPQVLLRSVMQQWTPLWAVKLQWPVLALRWIRGLLHPLPCV